MFSSSVLGEVSLLTFVVLQRAIYVLLGIQAREKKMIGWLDNALFK